MSRRPNIHSLQTAIAAHSGEITGPSTLCPTKLRRDCKDAFVDGAHPAVGTASCHAPREPAVSSGTEARITQALRSK